MKKIEREKRRNLEFGLDLNKINNRIALQLLRNDV